MADEKTGTEESNTPKPVSPTGTPPTPGDVPVPSPEHPPVSHIMPHQEVVPTEPVVVPPKPPVTSVMPPTPETKIPLTVAPAQKLDTPALQAVSAPVPAPKKPSAPQQDAIEAEVGLVRPQPKSTPPDPLRADMEALLKGIKLPEKRSYTPRGEQKPPPTVMAPNSPKLEDILAAHVTEHTTGPTPTPSIPGPSIVPDQNVFHEDMEVASVHTLKHDLQHVVQEQKMSVVKAVALEQEKRSRMETDVAHEPPRPPSRAPAAILTALVFLLLGLAALGGVYYIATIQSAPGPNVESASIVFAEQTLAFPLTTDSPQSLRTQLSQARTAGGTLGSLTHIVPVVQGADASGARVERPATLPEFFAAIGTAPPENLMRALGEDFFLGIHTVDKNAPILVIKVVSYDRAFDGMLSWERFMNADLAPVFTAVPRLVMGEDGLQVERPFTDLVMRNYDVRALKDDDGVIQLYYSFPTRDLLIIAESPYTFTEILSRLQAGRRL